MNLNSVESVYPNFGGPFAEMPCRPQDIDYHVPGEYLINSAIRNKLPSPKLSMYKEDLLFYFFYNCPGDAIQLAAAVELYNRDWRYHMEEKVLYFIDDLHNGSLCFHISEYFSPKPTSICRKFWIILTFN
jgi:CCR4-NOT transcription complex subunit 2